jgi:hypothetical protein
MDPTSARRSKIAWFDAGEAVFHGSTDPAYIPPLHDHEARRWWAGGFVAAWVNADSAESASKPDQEPLERLRREDLSVALMLALRDHKALAAQLLFEHRHDAPQGPVH